MTHNYEREYIGNDAGKASVEVLRECFDANFEAGILTWRARPKSHFQRQGDYSKHLNVFVGEIAGSIVKNEKGMTVAVFGKRYQVSHIIFALKNDHWPLSNLKYKDGNRNNLSINNLEMCCFAPIESNEGLFRITPALRLINKAFSSRSAAV